MARLREETVLDGGRKLCIDRFPGLKTPNDTLKPSGLKQHIKFNLLNISQIFFFNFITMRNFNLLATIFFFFCGSLVSIALAEGSFRVLYGVGQVTEEVPSKITMKILYNDLSGI